MNGHTELKAVKLASIRLAFIYLENGFSEPPSPGKVLKELILEANKCNEQELSAHWKEVNSWYKEAE